MSDVPGDDRNRCDFCRLPRPAESVTLEYGSDTYEFCSTTCRDEMRKNDRVFTEYHGFRQIETGVSALDDHLPEGLPRNSFVLLSGDEGTRNNAIQAELVWRTLQRDEPAVVVSFTEPPVSVVEQFLSLEWNVLPYLETGQLRIVDCFTYRVGDRRRMFARMDDWNQFLHRVTAAATATVRDPSDTSELQHKLDNCLEALSMGDAGIVVIDSLTEFGTLVQPVQAYDFVKDLRADVCKGRFVPVFAGATFAGEDDVFPHDLGYVIDGLVDLQLNGSIIENVLVKQVRIRKMNGVLVIPEWVAYEYTGGDGLVTFDPLEELERSAELLGDSPEPASDERSEEDSRPSDSADSEGEERSKSATDDSSESSSGDPSE
ncbi:ATPase domain-containing protein [Haladaptatus salinisoli]|uniref:ATPase domain-containing protein n=1 Tax=Haladaptatus salinisoli TaxID=2884876 RepID=UPI001D0BDCD4|nr:ATPase domain-containing protein [Haladaptatus salinisoli]